MTNDLYAAAQDVLLLLVTLENLGVQKDCIAWIMSSKSVKALQSAVANHRIEEPGERVNLGEDLAAMKATQPENRS